MEVSRLRAGRPLRSNVVGTYGSPTNAPWPAATDGSADRCGGNSASLKCGRNLRFPHKRPLPDCGEGVGIQDTFLSGGGWLLLEAGCCGQGRRFAPMRQKPAVPSQSSRNSFLSKFLVRRQPQYKKARLRPCLFLRFQLPGRRHLRLPPRLCRRRLPPGFAQPAHPV